MALRSLAVAAALAASLSLAISSCAGTGPAAPGGSGGARGAAATGGAGGGGRGGATGAGGGATPDGGGDVPITAGTGGGSGGALMGSGGAPGSGGGPGGSGGAVPPAPDGGAADRACQMAEYTFAPKVPTVYLVVDRSGSMFACVGTTDVTAPACADHAMSYWARLQASMLQVVQQLDKQVRFGFATFNGTAAGTCPDVKKVAPAVGNYAAIAALYNSLPFRGSTDKWETPTRRTLEMIGAELSAIPDPGNKYILLVTDGEPDYCGDGNLLCPPDAVVAELQALKAASAITTIVFGLQSAVGDIPPSVLQAFANAGAGEDTVAPLRPGANITSVFDQCFPGGDSSTAGWRADFLAKNPECAANSNMCRGRTIGAYAAAAGPTRPYTPDPANQAQLVEQLAQALSSVKGCTFDLGDVNGTSIKVDLTKLAEGHVLIMGREIPQDAANGWRMNTATELELVGTACASWRMPSNNEIDFRFPCSAIIFE